MADAIHFTAPLRRWSGAAGGSWYLLTIGGAAAAEIAGHALMRRLESGRARGFGAVKVEARIGGTHWQTSVFPQRDGAWVLPVKAAIRRAEELCEGDAIALSLQLL